MKKFLAIVMIGAVVVACSSDDDSTDGDTSDTPTTSADEVPTPTSSDSVDDEDVTDDLDALLVTIEDFPEGWEELLPRPPTEIDQALQQRNAECAGGEGDRLLDLGGRVTASNDFVGPDGVTIGQTVTQVDESVATDFMERLAADGVDDCFAESFAQSAEELLAEQAETSGSVAPEASIGDVAVIPLEVTTFGDDTIAYRMTIPVTSDGTTSDNNFDIVAVRSGGTLGGFVVASAGDAPSEETLAELLGPGVERLLTAS